ILQRMSASTEDLLAKNSELEKQIERMEKEHEETMTELFHNNDELTKRVAELEQRNKELFERCKLLNKNRSTTSKHECEMETIQQKFTSFRLEQDKKEKSSIDKINSFRDRNTQLIKEKNQLEGRLLHTEDRLAEVRSQCTRLSAELYDSKETNIQLTRDNNNLRSIKGRIIEERDKFKDHKKRLESELTQSQQQIGLTRNVAALLVATKKELDKSREDLENAKKDLETSKNDHETAKKNLEREVKDEKARSSTIAQEFTRMKSEKYSDQDYCSCSICCDVYDSALCVPRILDCGHTFCEICIEKFKNTNLDSCPTCKANSVFNSRAPVNYYAISVVDETIKNIPKARCETCEKVFQFSSEDTPIKPENNKAKEEDTGELLNLD
ncbi:hypothetical protein PRIPAC_92208, partial [Pristionchus pacificus]